MVTIEGSTTSDEMQYLSASDARAVHNDYLASMATIEGSTSKNEGWNLFYSDVTMAEDGPKNREAEACGLTCD